MSFESNQKTFDLIFPLVEALHKMRHQPRIALHKEMSIKLCQQALPLVEQWDISLQPDYSLWVKDRNTQTDTIQTLKDKIDLASEADLSELIFAILGAENSLALFLHTLGVDHFLGRHLPI